MISKNNDYPKVLVLTRNAWNNSISTGNTLSEFFESWPSDRLANIYCRQENIDNNICSNYFRITEQDLLRHIICKSHIPGSEIEYPNKEQDSHAFSQNSNGSVNGLYSFFGSIRFVVFLWARELLWTIGGWKNNKLDKYIDDFSPDIIYMPCYDSQYMHKILAYIKKRSGAKIVLFSGDDTYSLKQFSLSPFFWIDRFWCRRVMRNTVKMTSEFFVISDLQKKEYDAFFRRSCIVLHKSICQPTLMRTANNCPLQIVYTGNVGLNRWKVLSMIASTLYDIDERGLFAQLRIYTSSSISKKMKKAMNIPNVSFVMGSVAAKDIDRIQSEADILVHVESFDIKNRLQVRYSLSTKIVDYLSHDTTVLAVGPKDVASIMYLNDIPGVVVVANKDELSSSLERIKANPTFLQKSREELNDYREKLIESYNNNVFIETMLNLKQQ